MSFGDTDNEEALAWAEGTQPSTLSLSYKFLGKVGVSSLPPLYYDSSNNKVLLQP